MSIGNFTKRHSTAVMAVALVVIGGVTVFLSYPWLRKALQTPPKPVTQAYFYDTAKAELVAAPLNALASIARPDTPSGEATCVRAYVMSCGDCAEASGRFVGYLMRLNPEYKKALDAAPASLRARLTMPPAMVFEGGMFPMVAAAAPAKGEAGKPVTYAKPFKENERLQIAEVPGNATAKLTWRAPVREETQKLVAGLRARCDGKTPISCHPAEGE